MSATNTLPLLLSAIALVGCSSQALGERDGDELGDVPVQPRLVELSVVYEPTARVPLSATALAFSAVAPDELWVTLRQFPSGKPCTTTDQSGCDALRGLAAIVSDATSTEPTATLKEDGNSWHFMRLPTAIAWGEGELMATCGEARTDNFEDEDVPFAGPVLWSSSPEIFGVEPLPGQNGTHLDMLHETPFCMGIAHEAGSAYWAVNGDAGSLDRYDFHAPHQIGGEDHEDGEVHRYAKGEYLRVPGVPSHAAFDSGYVYLADTGHGRVLRVDPSTARAGGSIATYEPLHASGEMVGAEVLELVAPGKLELPSGLVVAGAELFVTDNASSRVYVFALQSGVVTHVYDTALAAGSLAGLAIGPDGRVYLTDLLTGTVYRFER